MLSIDRISVSYGSQGVLTDVSLRIPPGTTAVMGPSGSGKSTLLRIIAGTQAPSSGAVTIDGTPVAGTSWRSSGDPRIAMIFQDYRVVEFLTVGDNIALAAEVRRRPVGPGDVASSLQRVGLDPAMAQRAPGSLSGGEQQRVAIARALVTGATIVLADEPTGALDATSSRRVSEILQGLGDDGLTVVVATHDESVASHLDATVRLEGGALHRVTRNR